MTTKLRFHWWIGLGLLMFGGALGALFVAPREALPITPRSAEEQRMLRVVYVSGVSPDPHQRTFPLSSYNHFTLSLWEPLIECDPATGEPRPGVAESWRWSDDYRTLTLTLRGDARWSNGERVTAHDFVRGWLRLLRQRVDVAYTLFPLKQAEAYHRGTQADPALVGVRALDDRTLRIELDQPRAMFVAELADPLLVPLHASSEAVLAGSEYRRRPELLITNGPFQLGSFADDVYGLRPSRQFHGRAQVKLTGIQFIRADTFSTGTLLLAAGKADLMSPIGRSPPRPDPTIRALTKETELALAVVSVYFNTTRGPLQDVRVRQALALALNREAIIGEVDRDRLVPAGSWVPDMPGRPGLNLFREDPAEARRLLAEAGYPGGEGFPVLRLCVPRWVDGSRHPRLCGEQWFQELGVRVYVAYDSPDPQHSRLTRGDYDLTYGVVIATVPDAGDLLGTFLMPEHFSETKWDDPETRRLLTVANQKTGAERLRWLERGERRAMGQYPVVPLMFERRHVLRAAEVQGWYPDPLARQSLKHLSIESPTLTDLSVDPFSSQ